MRILFYINRLYEGGAQRAISNTASYFAEHGWYTILLTSYREGTEYTYSEKVNRMSIEDEQIVQSFVKRNISRMKAIRHICKREKVDVVVSFMLEPNCRAILATLGLQVKTIISIRSDPDKEYSGVIGGIIKKYLLPLADGVVFQTRDAQSKFSLKLQSHSAVIYNVVSEMFYDREYKDGVNIVACGRICPVKNYSLLIHAFQRVHKQYPKERLCIYGYGQEEELIGLKTLIDKSGLSAAVFIMGQSDDIPNVLATAKMFVLASDYEGMPNALMEAMAVGVPSISTDCPSGGPKELFGDELADMLVPVGNANALANKMIELLSDNTKRLEIGEKMRNRAKSFRADIIGEKWLEYVRFVCRGNDER